MNYIRNDSKASCIKSGLNFFVKSLRFLRLYTIVYTTVLAISNILSKRKLMRLYFKFVNEGDLCFDIGY